MVVVAAEAGTAAAEGAAVRRGCAAASAAAVHIQSGIVACEVVVGPCRNSDAEAAHIQVAAEEAGRTWEEAAVAEAAFHIHPVALEVVAWAGPFPCLPCQHIHRNFHSA